MSPSENTLQTRRPFRKTPPSRPRPGVPPLSQAVRKARQCLLSLQQADGHWCAELQGDTILESEYILLMAFLGREQEEKVSKAARYILTQQRREGAWSSYPGGPVDVSVSVKAYFALKLAGHSADAPYMVRARELILQAGGADKCNSFTKFYLAFLGQLSYDEVPSVPPELILLPRWSYINLYAMSSWTRTIVVPLSIFSAFKPVRRLPTEQCIAELFLKPAFDADMATRGRFLTAGNIFLAIDRGMKFLEKYGIGWLRKKAVARAARWMIEHFQDSDGVGAIFPPIIYTIISLHCLGHATDTPEMAWALKQLDDLMIEEEDTLRLQPCFSPVWDTALALNALAAAGTEGCAPQVTQAARWLVEHEVRRKGDWSLMNPGVEPGGWFFEYRNGFYPDTDDTAMVLMGLARTGLAWDQCAPLAPRADGPGGAFHFSREAIRSRSERSTLPCVERGLNWLLAMQNKDGGWAAFDRDINRELLTKVPFADHNAMLDPSCPDITARVLEALAQYGYRVGHPQVERAIAFIATHQDPRGCWLGRWGVNYLYGTWQVLSGVAAIGVDPDDPMIRKAVAWLRGVQQPSGAWGESCRSYDDPSQAGIGKATASQTGWALLGLMATGEYASDSVRRGVDYLIRTQGEDGNWEEDEFTGTGFPKVFYLKYHNYRLYFPMMALARYEAWQGQAAEVGYTWDGRN